MERNDIHNPDTELDCFYDEQKLTPTQSQYLANWYSSFLNWVDGVSGILDFLFIQPMATDEDKQVFIKCKTILKGNEVVSVKESLSKGIVTVDVLNKIESLNKKLIDTVVEHIKTDVLVKEFLRQLLYLKVEQDKSSEEMRLKALQITKG